MCMCRMCERIRWWWTVYVLGNHWRMCNQHGFHDEVLPQGLFALWCRLHWYTAELSTISVLLLEQSSDALLYIAYYCILPPKAMCSESHGLFKFWEISDIISETVQDCCNRRLIGNRTMFIEWHHCQCPWMTLKVTFAVWNLSISHTSWNIAWKY